MPKIPDAIPLSVPSPSRSTVPVARSDFRGLNNVSQVVGAIGRERREREDKLNYGRAAVSFRKSMMDAMSSLEDDDYLTYESRFDEAKKKALESAQGMIISGRDKQAFETDMESRSLSLLSTVRSRAKAKEVDIGRGSAQQALTDNRELVFEDPINAHQNALDILDGARSKNYLSEQEYVSMVNAEKVGLVESELEAMAPMERYEKLQSGKGTVSLLPQEKRNDMTLAAIQQQQALMTAEWTRLQRIETVRIRQEKEVAEAASKEGDQLFADGELTEDWVEANRDALDEADYRYFYKKLSGAENVTDAMIYADLRGRASGGDDVRDEARAELRAGRLKIADYDKIVSRLEQDVPTWMERGEQHIKTALRVSDVNPDPAAAQRQAQALDDWNAWAIENPETTVSEAQHEYRRIVKEFALIDASQLELVLRLPSYAVGSRNSLDLDATEQLTVEAYNNGDLSQEEFERQASLILEWESARQRREVTAGE